MKSPSYNALNKPIPMTNKKDGAYSMDIKINEMKAIAKMKNCSLNDYVISVYSNTLYQYFDSKKADWKDEIPRSINIGMPISLREAAKSLKDLKLYNDFINFPVKIPVRERLDDSLAILKPYFSSLKRSMRPWGALYAF